MGCTQSKEKKSPHSSSDKSPRSESHALNINMSLINSTDSASTTNTAETSSAQAQNNKGIGASYAPSSVSEHSVDTYHSCHHGPNPFLSSPTLGHKEVVQPTSSQYINSSCTHDSYFASCLTTHELNTPKMRSSAHTILSSTVPPECLTEAYKAATSPPDNEGTSSNNHNHDRTQLPPPQLRTEANPTSTAQQATTSFGEMDLHSPMSPSQSPNHMRRESMRRASLRVPTRGPSPSSSFRVSADQTPESQAKTIFDYETVQVEGDDEENDEDTESLDTVSIYHEQLSALLVGAEVIGYEGSGGRRNAVPTSSQANSPAISCCFDPDDVEVTRVHSAEVFGGEGIHSRSNSGGFGLTSSSPSPTAEVAALPPLPPLNTHHKRSKTYHTQPTELSHRVPTHRLQLSSTAIASTTVLPSAATQSGRNNSKTSQPVSAMSSQEDHQELISTLLSVQPALTPRHGKRHCTSLSVVAEGSDPASRYVKAKLAMGTEHPKEGKGLDMSIFRVGCDTLDANYKPQPHVYDSKKDLIIPQKIVAEEAPFADLLNPTSTWDLLHSIPDAIDKVNKGDILYRFSAKKYKDLTLEERVEVASFINMTGFKDELAENDQPILDFIHNKNSIGRKNIGAKGADSNDEESDVSSPVRAEDAEHVDIGNLLVVMVRLVGLLPRVTSREVNVDCVMTPEYQKNMAAPDEVFEPIDRRRTYRKNKNIIPFVFSFRFQMTGSEVVDDETMAEHAHHHDAKPTRIVLMERTKKHRGADSTIKSKAFNVYYDVPPRGISSITGKALPQEQIEQQNSQYAALSSSQRAFAEARAQKDAGRGGLLCGHTAIILRTSIPKAVAGFVDKVGNKVASQAADQIMRTRQFLCKMKDVPEGWEPMLCGGDFPNAKFVWE